MPRSAKLTDIANGLCGSFASRNNDLDGYWSIGKLRSLAERHGRTTVVLDVLASSIDPPSSGFAPVLARYRRLLAKLAGLSRIELENIAAARITLNFAPPPRPGVRHHEAQSGDRFTLSVAIDAAGKAGGVAHHAGYCRPHDPARESRSVRTASR